MTVEKNTPSTKIWSPSDNLSERVKRLREHFYSFDTRSETNEPLSFTTGTEWDEVYSTHDWANEPAIYPFFASINATLQAMAIPVKLPEDYWKHGLAKRRAIFFHEVMTKYMPVTILDGELIVGFEFNTGLSRSLNKSETKVRNKEMNKWFDEAKRLNEVGIGTASCVPGHVIPNYAKVMQIGMKGLVEEYQALLQKDLTPKHREFVESLILSCETARDFNKRYAEKAREILENTTDPERRKELEEIARICDKVPWNPPESFWESLQALWTVHMLVMAAESYPGAGLSHGRWDQYMYPFYKASIDSGEISPEMAKELLHTYWIKHNYVYDFQGRLGLNQGINSSFGQLMTLGGCGPNGEDMTNDLTWLALDVIEEMNLLEPKPNIRIHKNTPDDFLRRVAEMLSRAQGSPFLLNFDEHSIDGMVWQGVPREKAWDYGIVGCLENTMQGNDRSDTVDVNLNLVKAVEYALNDGKDATTGNQMGLKTGNPLNYTSYDDFLTAVKLQLAELIRLLTEAGNMADTLRSKYQPTPYLSAIMDGCGERGKDINEGGTDWNFNTVEAMGIATLADSLAAVKMMVYEQKRVSMKNLLDAISTNYEGHEELRQLLRQKAPKFGNDDDYVDAIARDISMFWAEEAVKHSNPFTGRKYRGGYLSWNYYVPLAPLTAATPDGRRRGEFLSGGVGAVQGMDGTGPTASIKSVGKLGLETIPNGASHTITLSPSMVRTPEHIDKLAALLRAYNEAGGTALQINIIDSETLRDAQANPDNYSNLLVRVTGYNAFFTQIGRELQEEIITRTEHSL
ncbi:MAG: pyruvate formate lyase family protein [Candidatus Thorarchaeota archaeon]|jgi:formate C-acetyltransferase